MKVLLLLQIAVMLVCLSYSRPDVPRVGVYGGQFYKALYDTCYPSLDGGYTLAKLRTQYHYVIYSEEGYQGQSYTLTEVEVQVKPGFVIRSAHALLPED